MKFAIFMFIVICLSEHLGISVQKERTGDYEKRMKNTRKVMGNTISIAVLNDTTSRKFDWGL